MKWITKKFSYYQKKNEYNIFLQVSIYFYNSHDEQYSIRYNQVLNVNSLFNPNIAPYKCCCIPIHVTNSSIIHHTSLLIMKVTLDAGGLLRLCIIEYYSRWNMEESVGDSSVSRFKLFSCSSSNSLDALTTSAYYLLQCTWPQQTSVVRCTTADLRGQVHHSIPLWSGAQQQTSVVRGTIADLCIQVHYNRPLCPGAPQQTSVVRCTTADLCGQVLHRCLLWYRGMWMTAYTIIIIPGGGADDWVAGGHL